ncbi:MAG TPA: DUF6786 family protein [Arachidicoccus sp.]|nr:DUF6786 family protein [Arachidicoccus sp.]
MSCKNNNSQEDNKAGGSVESSKDSLLEKTRPDGSFSGDLNFLRKYDPDLIVLQQKGDSSAQVIVSPAYQAKVFTSTANGLQGKSFGWVNYKAFSGEKDPHMNAYGGENRLWLGPEGGKFSLFFAAGKPMVFENWKTPAGFDSEPWNLVKKEQDNVTMDKKMALTNYAGTALSLSIERTIRLLTPAQIDNTTGLALQKESSELKAVAYISENKLTNTGKQAWNEKTGMPCLWILDMFNPSPSTVIVVPFKETPEKDFAAVATTDYFGAIPADRLKHNSHILYLKADGKSRGKLGVVPNKAKDWIGSYAADTKVLTLLHFDIEPASKYLNQEWNTEKPTFSGDAVNAYNDGPLEDGSQMGPFYEMESVSPAAFLAPGNTLLHQQSVYHFTGSEKDLNTIALKCLGVSLADIKSAFGK